MIIVTVSVLAQLLQCFVAPPATGFGPDERITAPFSEAFFLPSEVHDLLSALLHSKYPSRPPRAMTSAAGYLSCSVIHPDISVRSV